MHLKTTHGPIRSGDVEPWTILNSSWQVTPKAQHLPVSFALAPLVLHIHPGDAADGCDGIPEISSRNGIQLEHRNPLQYADPYIFSREERPRANKPHSSV